MNKLKLEDYSPIVYFKKNKNHSSTVDNLIQENNSLITSQNIKIIFILLPKHRFF